MWLWENDLQLLGFRRKGERYWLCTRRWGLTPPDHLSIYSWSELTSRAGLDLLELTEFHVTFVVGFDHLHFYYHELGEGAWQPGGHTARAHLKRLGCDARQLRDRADMIAEQFIAALGCSYRPRRLRKR